jgi:hypothetical protein
MEMSLDWKGKFLGAAIIDIYWFLTAAPSHAFPVQWLSIPVSGERTLDTQVMDE